MRFLLICLAAAAVTGCAAPPLYQWGGYEQALYTSYKDPAQVEPLRLKLEAHLAAMDQTKQKAAPGLYAELGTLYLQGGTTDKAIANYRMEAKAWPESATLMNSMIQNLERRKPAKVESPQ